MSRIGIKDDGTPERVVELPKEGDTSRPKPIQVLLVGGPMDAQRITCPAEATHVSYWVYKKPSGKAPKPEEYGTDATMKIHYQIHPMIGNTETWHIGRLVGVKFDVAINTIMEHYHARARLSNKRKAG